MEHPYDLLPHHRYMPSTRRQHVVNMTHNVKNVSGINTTITIDVKNKLQRFWRSAEGNLTAIIDETFPPIMARVTSRITSTIELDKEDARYLSSPAGAHLLVHNILRYFNLTTLSELVELETQVSLCLHNAASSAKDEGYQAIDAAVVIEVATIDTYDEEDAVWSTNVASNVAAPASGSSIKALLSQVFDNEDSSD